MKRKNIIAFSVALMAIGAFTSCSDEFLQDKKNYDYVDASTYNTFSGAKARVDDIYAWCLPNTSSEPLRQNRLHGLRQNCEVDNAAKMEPEF